MARFTRLPVLRSPSWLRRPVLLLGLCLSPMLASAQVYRCDSDNGVPLYQNSPGPRCKPLDMPNLSTIPAPKMPAQSAQPARAPAARGLYGWRHGPAPCRPCSAPPQRPLQQTPPCGKTAASASAPPLINPGAGIWGPAAASVAGPEGTASRQRQQPGGLSNWTGEPGGLAWAPGRSTLKLRLFAGIVR